MTTAKASYERGRGAIICRWFSHSWRWAFTARGGHPALLKYCARCGEESR